MLRTVALNDPAPLLMVEGLENAHTTLQVETDA